MKRLIVAFFLFSAFSGSAQETTTAKYPKDSLQTIDYREQGAEMPPLKLVTLDTLERRLSGHELNRAKKKLTNRLGYCPVTDVITNKELTGKGNVFLMVFNPTCGHCEDETELLKKHIGLFKKSRLLLLANPGTKTYLEGFIKNHKTADYYPEMLVGLDSSYTTKKIFLYGPVPQISVYDEDRKLIKTFSGEIPLDSLKRYIN